MSSPVGTYANFVDTQDVQIENVTDNEIYTQARTIPLQIKHMMTEHHLVTGYVEKLASLDNVSLPITALLTEPELNDLFVLSLDDDGVLPIRQWRVTWTSFSNNNTTATGYAKIFEFQVLDQGEDIATVAFRLEFESKMSASAVQGVLNII